MLDSVTREMGRLRQRIGAGDRRTVDDYFETIRAVEQRIQRAEASTAQVVADLPGRPSSIPADYDEHAKLMLDIEVLAYRADLTRIVVAAAVPRVQRADVSADRRARSAPRRLASSRQPGERSRSTRRSTPITCRCWRT